MTTEIKGPLLPSEAIPCLAQLRDVHLGSKAVRSEQAWKAFINSIIRVISPLGLMIMIYAQWHDFPAAPTGQDYVNAIGMCVAVPVLMALIALAAAFILMPVYDGEISPEAYNALSALQFTQADDQELLALLRKRGRIFWETITRESLESWVSRINGEREKLAYLASVAEARQKFTGVAEKQAALVPSNTEPEQVVI